jgi:thioredoxin reductase (NADPH)
MKALRIRNVETDETTSLDVNGCFVFIGFRPNTGIIEGHFEHDAMGYIVTDGMMQTSIPGLFAAGDLRSQLTRQVTTAVGDATTAAIAVEKYLKARRNSSEIDPVGSGGYAV